MHCGVPRPGPDHTAPCQGVGEPVLRRGLYFVMGGSSPHDAPAERARALTPLPYSEYVKYTLSGLLEDEVPLPFCLGLGSPAMYRRWAST